MPAPWPEFWETANGNLSEQETQLSHKPFLGGHFSRNLALESQY